MKSKVLIALTTVFVGAFAWIACEAMQQGVPPGAAPSPEAPPPGAVEAPGPDAGVENAGAETPAPGSPEYRARLAERTKQDFARRVERWRAAGKSEVFIAYMREKGLEQILRDIRTKPAEWFTIEAMLARIRARNERDAKLFLNAGFPPEQVNALLRTDMETLEALENQ